MRDQMKASLLIFSILVSSSGAKAEIPYGDQLCDQVVPLPVQRSFNTSLQQNESLFFFTDNVDNRLVGELNYSATGTPIPRFDYNNTNSNETYITRFSFTSEKQILHVSGFNQNSGGGVSNPWLFRWGFRHKNAGGVVVLEERFSASCKFNQTVPPSPGYVLKWNLEIDMDH